MKNTPVWGAIAAAGGLILAALLVLAIPGTTIAQDDPTPAFTMPELPTAAPPPTLPPPSIPFLSDAGLPSGYGGGVLVFNSDRDGDEDLYMVSAGGRELRQLTDSEGLDIFPTVSPDGGQIAFCSDRRGKLDLYVMVLENDVISQFTDLPGVVTTPDWSPDGSRIVFVHTPPDGNPVIMVMEILSGALFPLTSDRIISKNPAWSPDGSQIVFASERDGNSDLYVIAADGNGERRLTTDPASDSDPDWSPDGSRIVFNSDRNGADEIYTISAEGDDLQQLTENTVEDWNATWSPDGSQIAFVSYHDVSEGNTEIFVMDADGSNVQQVTQNPTHDKSPAWVPGIVPPDSRGTILLIFGRQYIAPIITTLIPTFEEAGYEVVIASHTEDTLRGKESTDTRKADLLLQHVQVADYDAVIFSCDNDITLGTAADLVNLIAQDAVAQQKVVGAICSGPRVLARAEVVQDKIVTGEPSRTCQMLNEAGGICTGTTLEQDGLMITARTRDDRHTFAEAILNTLESTG